eukprot:353481-Chlamydomonas_euryale.AAC.3
MQQQLRHRMCPRSNAALSPLPPVPRPTMKACRNSSTAGPRQSSCIKPAARSPLALQTAICSP